MVVPCCPHFKCSMNGGVKNEVELINKPNVGNLGR